MTAVHSLNGYRIVDLTKRLDPATEKRRLKLRRFKTTGPMIDYQSDMDIMSHLGTHVEAPYHHHDDWTDVNDLPVTTFMGRCVLLGFNDLAPNSYITADDLETLAAGRVGSGDIVIIDSPYKIEPFTSLTNTPDDRRLFVNRETAEWFAAKGVKAVGFGDGVSIENTAEDVCAFHDVLMEKDAVFLEVLKNIGELRADVFFLSFLPLPVVGLDACPVRAVAIEGLPGFDR